MRVALYARVSTQRQAQAQTVEQQLERLKGQAQQHGWDVPADQVFRDDGYSGASLKRPGLDRLRDRAAVRALDLVVITAPDRLARNYVHQVLLLEELQGHGCEVRFLDRPMSQDPHDQLLLQIRGAVAEYERTLITERMRRGRQRKLEEGLMLPWTRAPFGYRVDPDRPRDPAGVRIEEAEAAIVREMFAWYAQEAHSFCSLARWLEQRGIRTSTGLARWNLASIRALLTNPAYTGTVYGNRWHRRGTLERRSATTPSKHSAMSRVDAPREEWIQVAEIPSIVSQEQFDRVQARLASNRRFAQRNNKAHPYLLRGLVSCGLCGLACLARATIQRQRYYSCTGKLPALFSHREQKCPSRLSPAERLDELVWADLCALLTHPEPVAKALARAHGGHWLPQEVQARQQGLQRGQASLGQQIERLTDAYLAGVVRLDEYRRRRSELERRQQQLKEQVRQLEAQADRHQELAGLSCSIEQFCRRVEQGLSQASFEQRRSLVELLIDRVIVTDGEVEIRYVMPTTKASEQIRFCHLRLDYRAGSPPDQTAGPARSWLRQLGNRETDAGGLRGDGDDQEGAGSHRWRSRHAGAGGLCCRPFPCRRLKTLPAHAPCVAIQSLQQNPGQVESYARKLAAEAAARRVKGVKAVAEEIEVRLPSDIKRSDDEIAAAAIHRLAWDVSVPQDSVTVNVENGWVNLTGQLDWHYQKEAVEQDIRSLLGVVCVTNQITIKPKVDTASLGDDINHALHRSWFFNPDNIKVSAEGGNVLLTGTVQSPHDRQVAAATAWSAPGATNVENNIAVV